MIPTTVNQESYRFDPSALLSLYEIDARGIGGNLFRFHPGVNGLYESVKFNGIEYIPFPVEVTAMEMDGKGGLPRPKLKAANINGFLSAFLLTDNDLIGAKFIRRRVYARFIDAQNFPDNINPYGTPDTSAAYEDEIFYLNRKVTENKEYVEFECVSPLEIDNVRLPARKMYGLVCGFKYRDAETCGYSGIPVSDRFGKKFDTSPGGYGFTLNDRGAWSASNTYAIGDYVYIVSTSDFSEGSIFFYVCKTAGTIGNSFNPQFTSSKWISDSCPRNLLGCTAHFARDGEKTILPAGFFPGVNRNAYN